jgi:hypothetical protein
MRNAIVSPRLRPWLFGLYALAALLFLQPFIEAFSATWPPRTAELGWRFAVTGILYTMLPTVLFALLIAAVAAFFLGHRTGLRVVGVIALILGVVVTLLTASFVLDALQLRRIVRTEAKGGYDLAGIKAVVTALIAIASCAALGVGAFRATQRSGAPGPSRRRAAGEGIVIGQRGHRSPP